VTETSRPDITEPLNVSSARVPSSPVRLSDLAAHVGAERFQRACELALATAAGTGTRLGGDEWPSDVSAVPHELADLVEHDLPLAFALYRAMPCYANLMYVGYWGVGPEFWAELRSLLDDPDERLRDPVLYWLWCGPFEGSDQESIDAWREVSTGADDARLRQLLRVSGPVPWEAKAPLLNQLAGQPAWQPVVLSAIEDAAYDYFGRVNVAEARLLLRKLPQSPPELTTRLDEVEAQHTGRKDKRRKKQSRRQAKPQQGRGRR
jgi:hypothetical protein